MSQNPDPYKEWRQAGEGPHPTLAGNMFDPNVSADGKMRAGQGVGGTDETRLRQEGLEHIKKNTADIDDSTSDASRSTATALPSTTSTSNTMSSTGGVSGTASTGAADTNYETTSTSQDTGIMGTVKSWVGLGGDSTQTTGGTQREAMDADTTLGGTSGLTSTGQHNPISQQSGTSQQYDPEGRVGHVEKKEPQVSTSKVGAMSDPSTTSASTSKDSDGTDASLGTKSSDPAAAQQEAHEGAKAAANDPSDTGATKNPKPATGGQAQGGGPIENKSAIPTAGGQRLGEKHWGESKVVPDNPKPQAEEKISSAAGQPDSATASNTAANTGGATGGPGSSAEHEEGIAGKIKDRLHIGGK